jgi:hypothetical protein
MTTKFVVGAMPFFSKKAFKLFITLFCFFGRSTIDFTGEFGRVVGVPVLLGIFDTFSPFGELVV